ncbi:RNA-binding S4 domain-containing protein [Sandaracinobacteroides sp. A072]|uniref:RNA-binding S4 domain-containing protein n=1 Tax=Sandaracinobacteroides sp. A072 TaxID=3461146 RepID=UPI00404153BB
MVHERGMRLDKWLWFSRLSPSRSAAQALCESRRLRLDGRVIERSCTTVRPGAVLSFPRGDQVVAVRVETMAERRGPAPEARSLYTPLLPMPQARAADAAVPGKGEQAMQPA